MTATPTATSKRSVKPSDTLTKAATKAKLTPVALDSVKAWLGEQFFANMNAKLGQGGDVEGDIALRRVFVDLPVDVDPHDDEMDEERFNFLENFLKAKPIKLGGSVRLEDILLNKENIAQEDMFRLMQTARPITHGESKMGAILLIGGPGQGKSTLGQLACQLHRAALMQPFEATLSIRHQDLLTSFKARSSGRGDQPADLAPPAKPFLPLQVSLPELASWLAYKSAHPPPANLSADPTVIATADAMPLILQFLADRPSAQTCKLEAATLLALTAYMPCLLVLDGFDEVGAGKDRARLVAAARDLLTVLASQNASVQVLATTRPQGYAGELAQIGVALKECTLALLKRDEALRYAERLVNAKNLGVDEQHAILARLKEAANESAMQRLLTTPLQVTILSSLVQQSGRAPRERWNLFEKYFSYTYQREIYHNTYASNLLTEHRQHIIQIHARVALLLQVESERDGAAARMSQQRLAEVIDAVLLEDGIADDDRLDLVQAITVAAGQRLVFLVEPEPGSFGFEIRSLQEFMAAWAITSGREKDVEERLPTIAKASMFRNVILFIASRFFCEASPMRDLFADSICPGMDNDVQDELAYQSRAGSLLALEILEEGTAMTQPKRARALMACACGLLALPPGLVHQRLVRIANNKDTYLVLQQALEQAISKADNRDQQLAAWFCLITAIESGASAAVTLAARYWPQLTKPALLLKHWRRLNKNIGAWLSDKIIQMPTHFSPGDWIGQQVAGDNWLAWLVKVFDRKRSLLVAHGISSVVSVAGQMAMRETRPPAPPPACWQSWVLAADYEIAPDPGKLALALEGIADSLQPTHWDTLSRYASWPLATCLRAATDADDLRKFAQQARSGVLGEGYEWQDAEKEWRKGEFDGLSVVSDLSNPLWSQESLGRHPPLLAMQPSQFAVNLSGSIADIFKKIDRAIAVDCPPKLEKWLMEICYYQYNLRRLNGKRSVKEGEWFLAKWFSKLHQAGLLLFPRPVSIPPDTWLQSFDDVFRFRPTHFNLRGTNGLNLLEETGCHPKAVRFLIQLVGLNSLAQLLGGNKDVIQKYQHKIVDRAGVDWSLLQLGAGLLAPEQDDGLIGDIANEVQNNPAIWSEFIAILRMAALPMPRVVALLAQAYRNPSARKLVSNQIIDFMYGLLQARQSDLDKHSTWNRLALPLPYPMQSQAQMQEGAMPVNPVHIASLELTNIRVLHQLKLAFPSTPEHQGQWVVILGENGVGKTTLLRSIALGLRNVGNLAIWPSGVFSNPWLRIGADKATPIQAAEIVLTLGNGEQHSTTIRQNGSTSIHQQPDRARLFPLFAYGCRRGSALGGSAREVKLDESDGPEIATLFDDDADLIHAETWFRILESDAKEGAQYKTLFDAVKAALIKFLDLKDIDIRVGDGMWITEHSGLQLPFNYLSDGYLTSAGWFLDLIARWIEIAKQNKLLIDADFMAQMRGLVLIDEIDLHLHPRWQMEIIDRTRKLLPQMSFIVTTHNPLTLVGAKAQEIWILERENGRIHAKIQGDTPMLMTGGQIYRRYFGIEEIYPNGLGVDLQRYSFLTGFALRTDAEQSELEALQKKLNEAGIKPDWDVVPRIIAAAENDTAVVAAPASARKPAVRKAKKAKEAQ
jgi:hypothetical protein